MVVGLAAKPAGRSLDEFDVGVVAYLEPDGPLADLTWDFSSGDMSPMGISGKDRRSGRCPAEWWLRVARRAGWRSAGGDSRCRRAGPCWRRAAF